MKLLLTGISHKTAPVHLREKLAIPEAALADALHELQNLGASEATILSTCNRVEIALTAPDHDDPATVVERFLQKWKQTAHGSANPFEGHLYRMEARAAIHHLFRVASSLDSMVVGEPQILGQLKSAYAVAKTEGAVGGLLEQVLTRAFNVAKRVRTETGIGQMAVSVSYAAVELARNIFGSLNGHSVMIVGSGKMGELAAKHLHRSGARRIFVTNRTWERAEELAAIFKGRAVEYSEFTSILPEVDIVIASSGAPHYILTRDDMQRVIAARKNKPMFLIDIAVPRNIDPAVNDIEGVFLYDVDDLEGVVNANIRERSKQAEQAETIVLDEVGRMMERLKIEEITPTIISLQEQLEQIRIAEVTRALRRMPGLSPEQMQQIEAMTKSIVNKIAHGPISALRRNAGQPDRDQIIEAVRKVFHLQD
ncbi:MAG TPA: glutamyl-tRNA reductase [Bryobacteraceae bacterium]|jgi:glutamyl-tRNA reductase|nr:glutamyl-tRNA reductase [Bryobacteraceae bacterium]